MIFLDKNTKKHNCHSIYVLINLITSTRMELQDSRFESVC